MSSSDAPSVRFDDGKDPGALRTIGEVAEGLGIKQHILRYWEQQFPMLKPLKRSGGRRYYRPEDIALVETIDRLVNREGFTLKGAKMALKKGGASASPASGGKGDVAAATAPADSAEAAQLLAQLKTMRARLADALAV